MPITGVPFGVTDWSAIPPTDQLRQASRDATEPRDSVPSLVGVRTVRRKNLASVADARARGQQLAPSRPHG